jgi:hypothetical protein
MRPHEIDGTIPWLKDEDGKVVGYRANNSVDYAMDGSPLDREELEPMPSTLKLTDAGLTAGGNSLTPSQRENVQQGIFGFGEDVARPKYPLPLGPSAMSQAITVLGDSTGNETTEWVYLLAQRIGQKYPNHAVCWSLWDDVNERYGARTFIKAPPISQRSIRFGGTTGRCWRTAEVADITGDLDLRIDVSLDDWTPAANNTLMAKFNSSGNKKCVRWYIDPAGAIVFNWSADGSVEISKSVPSPSFENGAVKRLRVNLDVNNGSAGNTVTFYSSTDGATWTVIGSPIVTAGVTSVYNTTQPWEVGSRNSAGTHAGSGDPLTGNVYYAEIRQGIDGPVISPYGVESLRYLETDLNSLTGSPTIEIFNASKPGADITYLNNATRQPKMHPLTTGGIVFVSCSHNDTNLLNAELYAEHETLYTQIVARSPYGRVFYLTQNPRFSPAANTGHHAQRVYQIAKFALSKNQSVIDTYAKFVDSGASAFVDPDGIHPLRPEGGQLIADMVAAALGA